jgi:hypothetical protein
LPERGLFDLETGVLLHNSVGLLDGLCVRSHLTEGLNLLWRLVELGQLLHLFLVVVEGAQYMLDIRVLLHVFHVLAIAAERVIVFL